MRTIEILARKRDVYRLRLQVPDHLDGETLQELVWEDDEFMEWMQDEMAHAARFRYRPDKTEEEWADFPHDWEGDTDYEIGGFVDGPGAEPPDEVRRLYVEAVL